MMRTVNRWIVGVAVGVALGAGGVLVLQNVGTPVDGGREALGGPGEDPTEEPAPAGRVEHVRLSVAAPRDIPEGQAVTSPSVESGTGLSPSVFANAFTLADPIALQDFDVFSRGATGPLEVTLVALVLWRGAPGWFLPSEADANAAAYFQAGSVDRPDFGPETVARFGPRGGHVLEMAWNSETRVMRVQGMDVALGDDNVILVDGAGSAEGMRVVGTSRVAETRFTQGDYAALIHQSDELRDYLRCELPLPEAKPSDAAEQYLMNVLRGQFGRTCERPVVLAGVDPAGDREPARTGYVPTASTSASRPETASAATGHRRPAR